MSAQVFFQAVDADAAFGTRWHVCKVPGLCFVAVKKMFSSSRCRLLRSRLPGSPLPNVALPLLFFVDFPAIFQLGAPVSL